MLRPSLSLLAALALGTGATIAPLQAQWPAAIDSYRDGSDAYPDDAIEELVARIALYPDALLAEMLVAATFPDQLSDASRYVRRYGMALIDDQPWDVSVKSVAHYPTALSMLTDRDDWSTELGRAYASQPSDVMAAVQRLRAQAVNQGNLRTTAEHVVSTDFGNYLITPADPRTLYVPTYDASVIYQRPIYTSSFGGSRRSGFWSFGTGLLIGSWLAYDCDWRARRVYYDGWNNGYRPAGGWRNRSRPFIQITNVYVHPQYRSVYFNRDILRRRSVYVFRSHPRGWDRGRDARDWRRDSRDDRRDDRDWRRDSRDDRRDDRDRSRNEWQRDRDRVQEPVRDDRRRDAGRDDRTDGRGRRDGGSRVDNANGSGPEVMINPRRAEPRVARGSRDERP
jgi:hypothetical protein